MSSLTGTPQRTDRIWDLPLLLYTLLWIKVYNGAIIEVSISVSLPHLLCGMVKTKTVNTKNITHHLYCTFFVRNI